MLVDSAFGIVSQLSANPDRAPIAVRTNANAWLTGRNVYTYCERELAIKLESQESNL